MLTDIDKEAFRQSYAQVLEKFQAPVKDWPGFVRLTYDEQAMVMPPNAPAVQGHAAILAFLENFPPFSGHHQEWLELEGTSELLYSRDTISVTMEPPGAAPVRITGKGLTIWRRQADGSWKMFREMWNFDTPA